ncbi:SulP family inorganic anion transporter [Candidatus Peregrinibacteria bacterium]|nr:SulP family inorganic anion transporter [Candidatus Peregrinibacteria bacterium]
MAVIAAILVFNSVRMVEAHHFLRFLHHDRMGFFIALFVALITVLEDPLYGLILGTAISLIFFLEKLSHGEFDLTVSSKNRLPETIYAEEKLKTLNKTNDVLVYSIKGHLAYLNGEAHIAHVKNSFAHSRYVILRLRELYFIDLDGVEALDSMIEFLEETHKKILISGVNPSIEAQIARSSKNYNRLKEEGKVFKKTSEALVSLGLPLKS